MASMLRMYNSALQRRPMLTQCATAAFLFGAGKGQKHDVSLENCKFHYGCLFGPAMTKWYQFLGAIKFSSPTKAVIYRVFLDQAVLTPAAVGFFFGSMSVMEGKPQEAIPRIQAAYVPTIIRNWGVFIPTQIINFSVVPPHLRFVVVSVVSLFWNTYLSLANAQQKKAPEMEEQPVSQTVSKAVAEFESGLEKKKSN
ncbi:hypothetical protein BT96DRAFT_958225 [Gymnopus androsaceus JB14]|uniref:Uncharacterized protein n=1 Tax=Gymnopus androsaceus JB14 TaxID=1447944 RepID=A0A6A4HF84_9AGAR|nr:hypothetical protein BT96DRAFT_958225 [Gymnopus androsaceus JB14]